jgi:hypothetical protein
VDGGYDRSDRQYVPSVPYRPSAPLCRWRAQRADVLAVVSTAHAVRGAVVGPGRPLSVSKPLAHAYAISVMSEFQGFIRDLHDLAVETLVLNSGVVAGLSLRLIDGLTLGRSIDRGNATVDSIRRDFRLIGITPLDIQTHNVRWARDKPHLQQLVELRNALAHGNEHDLRRLRSQGMVDTVTWTRSRLPVLHRFAAALDKLVWNNLRQATGVNPWG